MNPQVEWDEGDMVVIDLSGKGEWLKQGDQTVDRPEGTWWIHRETAEKLLVALVQFFHPCQSDDEGKGEVF